MGSHGMLGPERGLTTSDQGARHPQGGSRQLGVRFGKGGPQQAAHKAESFSRKWHAARLYDHGTGLLPCALTACIKRSDGNSSQPWSRQHFNGMEILQRAHAAEKHSYFFTYL